MILIGCGSRDWTDAGLIDQTLQAFEWRLDGGLFVIDGAARGADRMVHEWALAHNVATEEFPAVWGTGRAAGLRRNVRMLEWALAAEVRQGPILTVAFKDGFDFDMRQGGTEHMVRITLLAGKAAMVVQRDKPPRMLTGFPAR